MSDRRAASALRSAERLRLLSIVPFPPRLDAAHGGRVVAQLLLRLSARHEVALLALRPPGAPPIDPALAERCVFAREVPQQIHGPGGPGWQHRRRMVTMPLTRRPSRVAALHSIRLIRAADRLTSTFRPHVIQIEDDPLAYLAPRLRTRAGADTRIVLVAHDPGVGIARGQAAVTAGRQAAAHRYETATWQAFWRRTLPSVSSVVTFTEEDARLVRIEVPGVRSSAIPLAIDIPEQPSSPVGTDPPGVLFVGGYHHPPNADAALRLIREIMPRVRAELPGLELRIVGADPTAEMLDAAGPLDRVTGRVPSVAPYVNDATLLALPIALGGGMRVKLLEAMAAGKALVASPLAAAGLAVTDGSELLIADGVMPTVDAIVALVRDRDRRRALGEQARAWARTHLSWEARVEEYEVVYRRGDGES